MDNQKCEKSKTRKLLTIFSSVFFLVIAVFVTHRLDDFSNDQRIKDSIIKNFTISQTVSVVGQPIKWIKKINTSLVNDKQHFLEVPGIANNVKISTSTKYKIQTNQTSSFGLTNLDRKKLSELSLEASKSKASLALAESIKNKNPGIVASFFNIFSRVISSMLAAVEISTTTETALVDVAPLLVDLTPAEAPTDSIAPPQEAVPDTAPTASEENLPTDSITSSSGTPKSVSADLETSTSSDQSQLTSTTSTTSSEESQTTSSSNTSESVSADLETSTSSDQSQLTSTTSSEENQIVSSSTASSSDVISVEYETPAPVIAEAETDTGKVVTVSAADTPDAVVTNVLAFTNIPEIYKVGQEDKIKIKWVNNGDQNVEFHAYDLNGNGKLDYVEWTVPHLSTQTFEIIFISKAFQLDENKDIVADIYDQVQAKDNNWAVIPDGNYVRVTFTKPLTNKNDNTIYARPTASSASVKIEVYPVYDDVEDAKPVATFDAIDHEGMYKVLLTKLSKPTDVFYLKIIGNVDIDYIVDPSPIAIGNIYDGGIVAYVLQPSDPGYSLTSTRGLMASLSDLAIASSTWGCFGTFTNASGTLPGTGKQNTIAIAGSGCSGNVTSIYNQPIPTGGFSDWYLPSKDDLNLLWQNIGNGTTSSNQNIGNFISDKYWSSSEYDSNNAWRQGFGGGTPSTTTKNSLAYVRPVRYFDMTVPDAPTSVSATNGENGQSTVSFSAPASNGGINILGYTVTSSPAGGTDTNAGTTGLSHIVSGLSNGTPYTFTVVATNAMGDSASSTASNSVTPVGAVTVPDAPTGVHATAGNAQAIITFTASASNGGATIDYYTASSSPSGINVSTTSATSVIVMGLTNGTAYTFTIYAHNSVGTSTASAASNSVTPSVNADITLPAMAPLSTSTLISNNTIILKWTAPGDDGDVGTATSYDLRYSSTSGPITDLNFGSAVQASATPTPSVAGSHEFAIVGNLSQNTRYYFALKTSDEVPNISQISTTSAMTGNINPINFNNIWPLLTYNLGNTNMSIMDGVTSHITSNDNIYLTRSGMTDINCGNPTWVSPVFGYVFGINCPTGSASPGLWNVLVVDPISNVFGALINGLTIFHAVSSGDTAPPGTSSVVKQFTSAGLSNGWIGTSDVIFWLNASDDNSGNPSMPVSGVKETDICMNQTADCSLSPGTFEAVIPEGINYIRYRSIDYANNYEATKTTAIIINEGDYQISPATNITAPPISVDLTSYTGDASTTVIYHVKITGIVGNAYSYKWKLESGYWSSTSTVTRSTTSVGANLFNTIGGGLKFSFNALGDDYRSFTYRTGDSWDIVVHPLVDYGDFIINPIGTPTLPINVDMSSYTGSTSTANYQIEITATSTQSGNILYTYRWNLDSGSWITASTTREQGTSTIGSDNLAFGFFGGYDYKIGDLWTIVVNPPGISSNYKLYPEVLVIPQITANMFDYDGDLSTETYSVEITGFDPDTKVFSYRWKQGNEGPNTWSPTATTTKGQVNEIGHHLKFSLNANNDYQSGDAWNIVAYPLNGVCADTDVDGYGGTTDNYLGCAYSGILDCNDNNVSVHPKAPEFFNGVDNSCTGIIDKWFDNDQDAVQNSVDNCPLVYNPDQIIFSSISPITTTSSSTILNSSNIHVASSTAPIYVIPFNSTTTVYLADAPLPYGSINYSDALSPATTQSSFFGPDSSQAQSLNNYFVIDTSKSLLAYFVTKSASHYTIYSQMNSPSLLSSLGGGYLIASSTIVDMNMPIADSTTTIYIADTPLTYSHISYNNILGLATTTSSFVTMVNGHFEDDGHGHGINHSLNSNVSIDTTKSLWVYLVSVTVGIDTGHYTIYSQMDSSSLGVWLVSRFGSGVSYTLDSSASVFTIGQPDRDGDGIGDACDMCQDVQNDITHTDQITFSSISTSTKITSILDSSDISLVATTTSTTTVYIADTPLELGGIEYNTSLSPATTQSSFLKPNSSPQSLNNDFAINNLNPLYVYLVNLTGSTTTGNFTIYSQMNPTKMDDALSYQKTLNLIDDYTMMFSCEVLTTSDDQITFNSISTSSKITSTSTLDSSDIYLASTTATILHINDTPLKHNGTSYNTILTAAGITSASSFWENVSTNPQQLNNDFVIDSSKPLYVYLVNFTGNIAGNYTIYSQMNSGEMDSLLTSQVGHGFTGYTIYFSSEVLRITIEPPTCLIDAKATAHSQLEIAYEGYTETDYSSENWATLTGYKTSGDAAITVATSTDGVTLALYSAYAQMATVLPGGGHRPPAVICTSWTYSEWDMSQCPDPALVVNELMTRTASKSPSGCIGELSGPVLSEKCPGLGGDVHYLSSIEISPLVPSAIEGENITFISSTLDEDGSPFSTTTNWASSNSSVGTINGEGVFTAISSGTTIITATAGTFSTSTIVTVTGSRLPQGFCFGSVLHTDSGGITNPPNQDVKNLQIFLNDRGFSVTMFGSENNNYDQVTTNAVSSFQEYYDITPSAGNFGNVTRNKVNDLIPGCSETPEHVYSFDDNSLVLLPGQLGTYIKNTDVGQIILDTPIVNQKIIFRITVGQLVISDEDKALLHVKLADDKSYIITAVDENGNPIHNLGFSLNISLPVQAKLVDQEGLGVYYFDESTQHWIKEASYASFNNNKTTFQVNHLTEFGIFSATGTPCTFEYTPWGDCQSDGTQTRNVANTTPIGCVGGNPIITQSCTPSPTVCIFSYTPWRDCQSDNTQTRDVASTAPSGCVGGDPITTQSCKSTPPTLTSTSTPTPVSTSNTIISSITGPVSNVIKNSYDQTVVAVQQTIQKTKDVINNPTGSIISKIISTSGILAGMGTSSVGVVALTSTATFSDLWLIISKMFGLLTSSLGIRKKGKQWGTVYDSITKRPLDPVYVSLISVETNKEVSGVITDIDGRYGFLVLPGKYRIEVKKTNYLSPSIKMKGQSFDEVYNDLYFGEEITISHEGEIITKNIPMDSMSFDWNEFAKTKMNVNVFMKGKDITWAKISNILFAVGAVVSLIAVSSAPAPYNVIIAVFYVVAYIFNHTVFKTKKSGTLKERNTNIPLSFAIIKIFREGENVPLTKKIADKFGDYYILVPNGRYYMTIEKKNDNATYSEVLKTEVMNIEKGIINTNFEI